MMETPPPRRRGIRRRAVAWSLPAAVGALRAIDARTEPDVKRAVPGVVVAVIGFSVGARLGGFDRRTPARFGVFDVAVEVSAGWVTLVVLALMAVFVLAGLMATRSLGRELARVVSVRGNVEAGNAIRLLCFIAGYAIVGFGVLTLLHVDLGNLLVGGAITGVVVGIAAQHPRQLLRRPGVAVRAPLRARSPSEDQQRCDGRPLRGRHHRQRPDVHHHRHPRRAG